MTDPELRVLAAEMSDAGFSAMRDGHNRLAVIAMGSAAEAILIDLLEAIPTADLGAAVASANLIFDRRYEVAGQPGTWRLVNLIKVAHAHPRLSGTSLALTDSLRDWRNLVHPALARSKGLADGALAPEALAGSGLLGILIRELSKP
jgi:hypothetical protein